MTQYTQRLGLAYPEGTDQVAVHADIEELAKGVDREAGSRLAQQVEHLDAVATRSVELEQRVDGMAEEAHYFVKWTPSKNLYDYTQDTIDHYVSPFDNGTLMALDGYRASDFIAVKAGQPYTANVLRHYALFDAAQVFVSGEALTAGTHTITPAVDGYIRFSYIASYQGDPRTDPATVQLEMGDQATEVVPFTRILKGVTLEHHEPAPDPPGPGPDPVGPLTVTRGPDSLVLTADHDGDPLEIRMTLTGGPNRVFNFNETRLAGTRVHNNSDDVAPIRTQHGTIGANHGYARLGVYDASDHDKTTADLGSVWASSGRELVLIHIDDEGRAYFGGDYTLDSDGVDHVALLENLTEDLTHIAGATNTAPVDHTKQHPRGRHQLYPSVQNIRQAVFVDGRPLIEGTRSGQQVEVRESYEILHYPSLYDTVKANPGTPYTELDIDGAVRVESVYRFVGGGVASVDVNLTEMQPTDLTSNGIVQSNVLAGNVTRYSPGVKPIDGHDWSGGVDLSEYDVSQVFTTEDLHNPTAPPVMTLDVRDDVAFVLGIHPWKPGASYATERLASAPDRLWDMRSTGKSYPVVFRNIDAGWGRYESHAVRAYLTPSQAQQVASAGKDAFGAWAALETVTQLP